jgi:hypothetical protein
MTGILAERAVMIGLPRSKRWLAVVAASGLPASVGSGAHGCFHRSLVAELTSASAM